MSQGSSEKPPANLTQERIILLTLAAVQFTSIVDFMVIMPLGPQLMRSMDIGPAEFGLVVSSYTFAAGVAGLIASSWIDRLGRKAAFLSLDAGFLVGTLLCGLAPTYATLVGRAARHRGVRRHPGRHGDGDHRRRVSRRASRAGDRRLMSAFALASVAGVPFGLYLGTKLGWHAPFVLLAALGCPVLAVAAVTLPPLRDHIVRDVEEWNPCEDGRDFHRAQSPQRVSRWWSR